MPLDWWNLCRTVCRLSFRFFSAQVAWPAKYGCDSKILKTFPLEQTWRSSLSVEVRVSNIWWLGTSPSNNMVVKSLPPLRSAINFCALLLHKTHHVVQNRLVDMIFFTANSWNSLPENIRTATYFKSAILQLIYTEVTQIILWPFIKVNFSLFVSCRFRSPLQPR